MKPALVFLGLLGAGLTIGTLVDRPTARAPVTAGRYSVLVGDFHVHGFPGDGALAPWVLRDEAARTGVDVFALTNHNRVFTARFAARIANLSDGPIVLVGQEVTNPTYHLIAVGIEEPVNAFQPAAAAIDDIHAQGGVAIAAHPGPSSSGYDDMAIARLDGSERAHSAMHVFESARGEFADFFQRAKALNPDLAAIGSSDFHASPALGRCRTLLFVHERTRDGVLEAIRHGRTVAMDADGQLYGDPDLVRIAETVHTAGRTDVPSGGRRASLALAWFGVLGLLVFSKEVS